MKDLKAAGEFVVGKHEIGYISPDFKKFIENAVLERRSIPTFQKLPRDMNDATIESELKPGMCELGDILTFLDAAPTECKDGNWNLFYLSAFVVAVDWYPYVRAWRVNAWHRDGTEWSEGRVFSPATDTLNTQNAGLGRSETLPLELTINGVLYRRV